MTNFPSKRRSKVLSFFLRKLKFISRQLFIFSFVNQNPKKMSLHFQAQNRIISFIVILISVAIATCHFRIWSDSRVARMLDKLPRADHVRKKRSLRQLLSRSKRRRNTNSNAVSSKQSAVQLSQSSLITGEKTFSIDHDPGNLLSRSVGRSVVMAKEVALEEEVLQQNQDNIVEQNNGKPNELVEKSESSSSKNDEENESSDGGSSSSSSSTEHMENKKSDTFTLNGKTYTVPPSVRTKAHEKYTAYIFEGKRIPLPNPIPDDWTMPEGAYYDEETTHDKLKSTDENTPRENEHVSSDENENGSSSSGEKHNSKKSGSKKSKKSDSHSSSKKHKKKELDNITKKNHHHKDKDHKEHSSSSSGNSKDDKHKEFSKGNYIGTGEKHVHFSDGGKKHNHDSKKHHDSTSAATDLHEHHKKKEDSNKSKKDKEIDSHNNNSNAKHGPPSTSQASHNSTSTSNSTSSTTKPPTEGPVN